MSWWQTTDAWFTWTIQNLAEITADDGNDVDSTTDSNATNDTYVDDVINNAGGDEDDHDGEEITVGEENVYDLALMKSLNASTSGPFEAGDTVSFDIEVINQWNVAANNIVVTDYIPYNRFWSFKWHLAWWWNR